MTTTTDIPTGAPIECDAAIASVEPGAPPLLSSASHHHPTQPALPDALLPTRCLDASCLDASLPVKTRHGAPRRN